MDQGHIAEAFGHFLAAHIEKLIMHPEIRKNLFIIRTAALRNFIFVMREFQINTACLLYTSPSPRDKRQSRMPSSA